MDLVTVTGYKSVAELMCPVYGMDNNEWQNWFQYWTENLFGPFANNYMSAQNAAFSLHAFGGGNINVEKYMAKIREDEPEAITPQSQQTAAYQMILEFQGKEAADKWRGAPTDAQRN